MDRIIEKYRAHVTPEHKAAMDAVGLVHALLKQHRDQYEALIESERHMHNVGGLIDPTLYRDMMESKNLKLQLRMCTASLAFLKEIDAVASEASIIAVSTS